MNDHIGKTDDHSDLGDLCRLKLDRSDLKPSPRTIGNCSKRASYQYHGAGCDSIQDTCKLRQDMIIKHGYKQSTRNTYKTDRCLLLKKVHIIIESDRRCIGTRTVQHDQTKTGQKNDGCHETVIIIIRLLYHFRSDTVF